MKHSPITLTPMQEQMNFSVADGLAIQTEQVDKWCMILKEEVANKLRHETKRINEARDMRSGFDVWRGIDIDNFVMDLAQIPFND